MVRLFVYVLVSALSFGAGYYFSEFTRATELSYVAGTAPEQTQERITSVDLKEDTDTYLIDVTYPKFNIPPIDVRVDRTVAGIVRKFREIPPVISLGEGTAAVRNELTIQYEPPYVGADIVSFKLSTSEYTGGAHPFTRVEGMNFTKVGKRLLLEDALSLTGLSLKQVSVAATAQLKERLSESFLPEGAEPNSKNFESFIVSENKVTFIFQEYQVGPYAAGPQEISFDRVR